MLKGKKIVLGVTGGIAVYKAVDLVSKLRKQGAEVRVVMTEHAQQFVTPLTFKEISGNKVAVSMSMAILRVLLKYSLNESSYSQTLLLVVYTVPVQ